MRVGQNPAKSIDYVKKPENITVAIITYIPFLSGYYKESLDILKICLNSLWENTKLPFDLMVFDNASCKEVTDYLLEMQSLGKIQYLTLSDKNIGKRGGWNFIFNAAPGKYIAYADADIEFYENWLIESIKIIDTFPNVGMVTGRPLRTPKEHFTSVINWVEKEQNIKLSIQNITEWKVFKQHTISCGTNEEQSKQWYESSVDYQLKYKGVFANAGAAHFQFVGIKRVLQTFLPFEMDKPMGQVRQLDIKLNDKGYLRLCTSDPLVKHLGNKIIGSPSLKDIQITKNFNYFNLKIIKKPLMYLYNKLFDIYYDSGN